MAYGWVFDDGSDGETSDRESPKLLGKGEGRLVLKSDVATRSISMEVGTRRWSVGGGWCCDVDVCLDGKTEVVEPGCAVVRWTAGFR